MYSASKAASSCIMPTSVGISWNQFAALIETVHLMNFEPGRVLHLTIHDALHDLHSDGLRDCATQAKASRRCSQCVASTASNDSKLQLERWQAKEMHMGLLYTTKDKHGWGPVARPSDAACRGSPDLAGCLPARTIHCDLASHCSG